MNGRRFCSVLGTVAVATIAAYASYEHMRALSVTAGQTRTIAALLPFSVDGLVVVCSIALIDGRERKGSAWFGFLLGVSASIVANILAAGPSLVDRCVSAWPSIALLVTIEVIARSGKRALVTVEASTERVSTEPTPFAQVAEVTGAGKEDIRTLKPTPAKPRRTQSAAAKVAAAAKRMPDATPTEIAAKAGVTERTARRHLDTAKGVRDGGHPVGNMPSEPARNSAPVPISPTGPDGPVARVNGTHVLADISI